MKKNNNPPLKELIINNPRAKIRVDIKNAEEKIREAGRNGKERKNANILWKF